MKEFLDRPIGGDNQSREQGAEYVQQLVIEVQRQLESDEIEIARAGLNRLVELTYEKTYKLAHRLTGNEEDAADVTQDTYIRMQKGLPKFRSDSKFGTWLYRITTNVAKNHHKKQRSKMQKVTVFESVPEELLIANEDPHENAEAKMLGEWASSAIESLRPKLREVIELKLIDDLSHDEIAKRLDITENNAKGRLFRARKRLREIQFLDEYGDEVEEQTA